MNNTNIFGQRFLSGGTVTGEIINKTKDGRLVTISGTNSPILDENGKILGFLAVHQDITERKKSEEALALLNLKPTCARCSLPWKILCWFMTRMVVMCALRPPIHHVLIKPPEELLGQLIHDVFPKETADRFLGAIRQTLDSGETSQLEYDLTVGK